MKALMCIIALLFFTNVAFTQELQDPFGHSYFEEVNKFVESGDFLFATKLLSYVSLNASDSSLVAEALYRTVEVGHLVAEKMNRRLTQSILHSSITLDSIRQENREWAADRFELIHQELKLYHNLGLDIHMRGYATTSFKNDYSSFYVQLITNHPDSKWTEKVRAEGIWELDDYDKVIKEGLSFLEKFPKSKYRYLIYGAMGCAYSDKREVWESANAEELDSLRLQAVNYYEKALEANPVSKKDYGEHLEELKKGDNRRVCFVLL